MPRLSHKPMKARRNWVNLASARVTHLSSARVLQDTRPCPRDQSCCSTCTATAQNSDAAALVVPNTKCFHSFSLPQVNVVAFAQHWAKTSPRAAQALQQGQAALQSLLDYRPDLTMLWHWEQFLAFMFLYLNHNIILM